MRNASRVPKASTCTEWSMTSSAGTSGLIFDGSPPRSAIASRIAARSTIAGTPVKSCITTRAGVKAISLLGSALWSQLGERLDVLLADGHAVLVAQQVLQQDLQRERQAGDVELLLQRVEAIDLIGTPADFEVGLGVEGIVRHYVQLRRTEWVMRQ